MLCTITDTQGIVALAAAALAVVSIVGCVWLAISMRRLRSAQRVVLGDGSTDLIAHAARLHEAFESLRIYVEEAGVRLEARLDSIEDALGRSISYRSLVRYDAYNELSGRQSMSIALLDASRSGIVLSCIHHRDQARVYAKQVHDGRSELELSPEEEQAIHSALAAPDDAHGS